MVSSYPSVHLSVDRIVSALYLPQYLLDTFHIYTKLQNVWFFFLIAKKIEFASISSTLWLSISCSEILWIWSYRKIYLTTQDFYHNDCFDPAPDLALGFSRSDFEIAVSQEGVVLLAWNKKNMNQYDFLPVMWLDHIDPSTQDFHCFFLSHPWPCPWIFKVKFWNSCISGIGCPIGMEQKGYESILILDSLYDLDIWPHPWRWP